jgi:hypothetical protein
MAAAFIGGQFVSGPAVQQYDPGQAGRGEQVLTQLGVVTPPAESVLIQARAGEQRLEHATARDVRRVAHDVAAALAPTTSGLRPASKAGVCRPPTG